MRGNGDLEYEVYNVVCRPVGKAKRSMRLSRGYGVQAWNSAARFFTVIIVVLHGGITSGSRAALRRSCAF